MVRRWTEPTKTRTPHLGCGEKNENTSTNLTTAEENLETPGEKLKTCSGSWAYLQKDLLKVRCWLRLATDA